MTRLRYATAGQSQGFSKRVPAVNRFLSATLSLADAAVTSVTGTTNFAILLLPSFSYRKYALMLPQGGNCNPYEV